ncbi:galactokinase [bacterium]|nr:galactokinase [bacterium]
MSPTDATLAQRFAARYGRPPTALVRAPGRVNLIGEHTDYNGLPVLPFAIDRAVRIAAAPRADRHVVLASSSARFPPRQYLLAPAIEPAPSGDWANYHRAAAQGLIDVLGPAALRGGDFLIDGDVPPGAGLSSSSALVVGSMLGLLAISGRDLPPAGLAELAARAERYVGTQSGGMDQAVCLLAQRGHALRIAFDPLRTRPVPIPAGAAFVVCHSLVEAEKAGAARDAYNQRVRECARACRIFDRLLGGGGPPLATLGELRRRLPERPLRDWVARFARAEPAPDPLLLRRVRHVLTEAERVDAAAGALAAGEWEALGALMDASHASCRDDYEISCEALEALVAAARAAGALGARLTGAGFGGCTINLVPAGEAGGFVRRMRETFYRDRPAAAGGEPCFVVAPSAGASVQR